MEKCVIDSNGCGDVPIVDSSVGRVSVCAIYANDQISTINALVAPSQMQSLGVIDWKGRRDKKKAGKTGVGDQVSGANGGERTILMFKYS
jgi:hypothetical protein